MPPVTLTSRRNTIYTYESSLNATVHRYTDPTGAIVIVKYAPKKEVDTHREISQPLPPSTIRLLNVIDAESDSFTGRWMVLEYANNETFRDLLANARDDGTRSPELPRKIPAAFCFHVLASILDAVITLQETYGVQHIDLHAGNIVFHMPESGYPPLVKIIDFGKVFRLPENEGEEDDVSWDDAESPVVCFLIRALLNQQADVLEDEFLEAIRPLRTQTTSLRVLKAARASALVRAADIANDVPQWLATYFGEENGPPVGSGAVGGNQNGSGYDGSELGELIMRLRVPLRFV